MYFAIDSSEGKSFKILLLTPELLFFVANNRPLIVLVSPFVIFTRRTSFFSCFTLSVIWVTNPAKPLLINRYSPLPSIIKIRTVNLSRFGNENLWEIFTRSKEQFVAVNHQHYFDIPKYDFKLSNQYTCTYCMYFNMF